MGRHYVLPQKKYRPSIATHSGSDAASISRNQHGVTNTLIQTRIRCLTLASCDMVAQHRRIAGTRVVGAFEI